MKKPKRSSGRGKGSAAAAVLALVAFPIGCGSNVLPPNPLPGQDPPKPPPAWYPEKPWSAKDGQARLFIEGKIVFDTNKAIIKQPKSEEVLKKLLQFMQEHPEVTLLRVEGHTDSRASEEHNQELSAKRSLAVCDWLVDNGVDHTRLIAVGFGESRPLGPNEQEAGRADNRRTEFHVAEVNGRPFAGKDPYNGGFALEVLSLDERKKKEEQERLARQLVFKVPPPFRATGDQVKKVDKVADEVAKKPRKDGDVTGPILKPDKVEEKPEEGADKKKEKL